ncbi:SusC/RagA family TonB-linked outer membrane protein [Flavobacterium sp. LHD-80]|uniref:SusC/RagA family TonB-linked outer membrane protein n=1 Tax=Flavobacterium sp. LHD-80 TaxID=3071411 RepID=UPI0027DF7270|nr:SusC/RagA family TonB-linked outer membrane protein [Flavobacterium sp. LHD-80]MDQ6472751.1 SusC/RagA family TonB-linked outer membrane protein [Flavobacterium sp. LHD-80]
MNIFSFSKGGRVFYCLFFLGFLITFSPISAKNHFRQNLYFSQQHKIQGTVTDGSNPLPGVTIAIKNKKKGAVISDYNGQFSLITSPYDTLVVSYIGFKTALVPIQGRSVVNIILSYDSTTLQEVRVNAGYYSVKESERTGSIARITSKDIETQPVTNVLATMQGRMAGVNVTQTTGTAGGGFEIQIRGQNSIRPEANAPLYIIDGVPYASDAIGYSQTSTIFPTTTSPLNSINPDAIESIEILKDADATAIYGSRGANGVVLITTKKGKEGKTKFTFNASTGAGSVTRFMKLMNTEQYLTMRREAYRNDKITTYPANAYDVNGIWDQNRYTDWQKELIGGTSSISDYQASMSGGSKYTQFLFSGNYHSESTVFPGDFLYKKGGSQFSVNHQSADNRFRVVLSVGYTAQNNDQPASDLTTEARALAPNAPALYDKEGNLNWENGTWDNPLRNMTAQYLSKTKDILANTVISYEVIPDLLLKSNLGYSDTQHTESRTRPSTVYSPAYGYTSANSSLYLSNTQRNSWIIEPQLNWKKDFAKGRFDLIVGGTFQQQTTTRLFQSGSGFTSNSLIHDLSSATTKQVLVSDETIYKYQAFFGRINYNWQDRYIMNLTGRRDGSSRFGPGNQFATFGAMGVAWLFSNESFLKNSSWLSFGKIRGSYGTTGNDQIGDYQFLDTYSSSGVNYQNIIGLQPSRLYNADFGWEINKKLEAALELGFFSDRIFLTGAWYQNRSSNQLVGIPLAGTTGFTQLQANLEATVENTGIEFTLRTVNFSAKSFKWTSSINLSFSKNKLVSFPNLKSSTYKNTYRIGEPLNIQLLYHNTGVDPQTGIYQFTDENKDGLLSSPDDKQTVVSFTPDYFGGFQNQLSYKNWKLDFLFQFVKQRNASNLVGMAGNMANRAERLVNNWKESGDIKSYQLYTTGLNTAAVSAQSRYTSSDATVMDASYIRLKTLSLSYNLPLLLKDMQCSITLQGQNLLTFTSYDDGDPEFKSSGYLPPLKIINAGIQLTF